VDGRFRLTYDSHAMLISKALENRMDMYKLGYLLVQMFACIIMSVIILLGKRTMHNEFTKELNEKLTEIGYGDNLEGEELATGFNKEEFMEYLEKVMKKGRKEVKAPKEESSGSENAVKAIEAPADSTSNTTANKDDD